MPYLRPAFTLNASSGSAQGADAVQSMYVAEYTDEQGWQGGMQPYGPLQLDPSAQVCLAPV